MSTTAPKPRKPEAAFVGKSPTPAVKPNAWSKPLKTSTPPPPGLSMPASPVKPNNNNNNNNHSPTTTLNPALRARFLHLLLSLVGQKVQITLDNGAAYSGIFYTATPFGQLPPTRRNKYVLKAVTIVQEPNDEQVVQSGQTLVVDMAKVVQVHIKSMRLDGLTAASENNNSTLSLLETDTEISSARHHNSQVDHSLVVAGSAWTTPNNSNNTRVDGLLGDRQQQQQRPGLQGSIGNWDQFKANEELFNVKGSYDENLYTTALDKTNIPARQIQQAEQIAREIESSTATNIHLAEERNQVVEGDYDEEDLYSGVLKTTSPKKQSPAPKKAMNYAAAAAKADAKPPGLTAVNKTDVKKTNEPMDEKKVDEKAQESKPSVEKEEEEVLKPMPVTPEEKKEVSESKETAEIEPKEEESKNDETEPEKIEPDKNEPPKAASKLNANAKEFTLNINAKTFTPGGGGGGGGSFSAPPPEPIPQQFPPYAIDPATGMPLMAQHMQGAPQYMPGPMGQPAMMHMMNPQYPGMRYPGYPGMEQQAMPQHGFPQMQVPVQQQQPSSVHSSAAPSPVQPPESSDGAQSVEEPTSPIAQPQDGESPGPDSSAPAPAPPQQQQPPQQPPPQQQYPMHYNMQPQGNFGQMGGMHPQQRMGYPPQQFMQHQIPVMRPMYPMPGAGMPPNMMRGPGGYYPGTGGPMPYPPYGYEDDGGYRGGGHRGGGRGRGGRHGRSGRGRGSGGRGGRNYNHQQPYGSSSSNPGSGRQTPQTPVNASESDAAPPPAAAATTTTAAATTTATAAAGESVEQPDAPTEAAPPQAEQQNAETK